MSAKISLSDKIKNKFKMSSFQTVKDFQQTSKCPLSLETLTAVINRGKEPSIPAFIQMAYCLGISPDEIAAACKAAGDDIFWRLIQTEGDHVLDKIKRMDDIAKKKMIQDLLASLGV